MVETHRPTADYTYLLRDEKLVLQRLWEPIPQAFYSDPSASDEENDMMHAAWIESLAVSPAGCSIPVPVSTEKLKPEWRDVPVRVE